MDKLSWQSRIAHFITDEREKLVRYVRRYIDDTAEWSGEDIVQDVLLNIFNKTDFTIPIDDLAAYVYQAIRNRVIDYLRRRRFHLSFEGKALDDKGLILADILPDPRYEDGNEDLRLEIRQRFFKALDELSDLERELIMATELENRTFTELSKEWGVPIGTLLARKSRAMKKIKDLFSDLN